MCGAEDKGTTSSNLVREALQVALERGLDVSPALKQARIDSELIRAPRARVPALAFCSSVDRTGRPDG